MGALARDGAVGFWAAESSTRFEENLSAAGLTWRRVDIETRAGGPEHSIYLARPPEA